MAKLFPTIVAAGLLPLASACYTGLPPDSQDPPEPGVSGGGITSAGSSASAGDDDSGGDDEDEEEAFAPDPGQVRLLSAAEFSNTVRDLLGVEVTAALNYSDIASGYDNGSNGQIDENLLSILLVESERVAAEYVASRLPQELPCFDPEAEVAPACAEAFITDFGRRAYRRPVSNAQRKALVDFVAQATADAEAPSDLMTALVIRMLMSPHFLYRTEVGVPSESDPKVAELDPFERASLISYALTGTMPDDLLLAAAEAGELDGEAIREQVHRLLDSPQGRAQLAHFFKQWLRVGDLDTMAERPEDYPKFGDPAVAQALGGEFTTFIDNVVVEEAATWEELLTRELTYVNRHTAQLYGTMSDQDDFHPLALEGGERSGILTLASVMAVHSSSAEVGRDKPIRRGLLIKNQFQCEEIGLPSGIDVNSAAAGVLDQVEDFDALTTREQFELIMNQDELCMTCHTQFMPFGYLWSNFDALGQFQTHFGERMLNSAVDDVPVDGESQSFDGIMELIPTLAQSPQATECFSTNVVRFASGVRESNTAEALTEELATPLREGELSVLELFEEVLARPEIYLREAPSR